MTIEKQVNQLKRELNNRFQPIRNDFRTLERFIGKIVLLKIKMTLLCLLFIMVTIQMNIGFYKDIGLNIFIVTGTLTTIAGILFIYKIRK